MNTYNEFRELTPTTNYGILKRGQPYRLLEKGRDWYLVSALGKAFYAPPYVFDRNAGEDNPLIMEQSIRRQNKELDDEEENLENLPPDLDEI